MSKTLKTKATPLLAVEWWPIAKPVPYARNARKISKRAVDKLAASIQEFGWRQPIVVDRNAVIVAGHTRLMAAQKLGLKKVPVHVASDLTEAQIKAYRLMDNRSHDESEWDMELVEPELLDLKALEYDLALTGFEQAQIQKLMAVEDPEEDNAPPPPALPVTVTGDLWLLGGHRVLCGDSTSIDAVERLCGATVDMVFTDPPYGIDYQDVKGKHGKIAGDGELSGVPDLLALVLARDCPMFVCCNWRSMPVFQAAMAQAERDPKACIVWDKMRGVQNLDRFYKRHEFILYWGPFGGQKTVDGDVWQCDREVRSDHPTAKPVSLCEKAVGYASAPGHTVLDLFGGSGSTLIACEKTGRNARLMELDPKYVDVIVTRWQQFTGLEAVLDDDGRTFDAIKASRTGKNKAA